jgi:hypothetical protein
LLVGGRLARDDSGIDGGRLHDTKDFFADGVVDHESSERDAARATIPGKAFGESRSRWR